MEYRDYYATLGVPRTAIQADINQYAVTWGTRALREAIAENFSRRFAMPVDADDQVTVCCGATEAMMASMMAIIDPGDEVVIFEPFYENYGPDAILSGATPRYVTLREPASSFKPALLSNGVRTMVPPHVASGTRIVVLTEDGAYVERAKD